MDPQQVSRNRGSYAPEFHYPSNMVPGMDMQLPPIAGGGGGGNHDGRGSYDSGSAAAAAAAAQHHRANIGGHSPRIGQSPQQGHPAMFSQAHGYAGGYGGAFGAAPQPGGHHGYQQQPPPQQQQQQPQQQQQQQQPPTPTQQQHMYGAYGQHAHLQHHASSPHQHYSHVPGSSVGLGAAPGQFPGGPMMGGTDMYGHPSYTHVHHGGHHGVPGGYGSHFQVMPHMQGAPNVVMPGQQHLASMSASPVGAMHPQQTQSQVGPARQGKQPGQRGRKKKDQSANVGAGAAVTPSLAVPPASATSLSAMPPMSPDGKSKGANARHHPYGDGESKGQKKKEKEPPKPAVLKSHLKPPKQAPSAWQVYFTEELQKMKQESPGERLNVAHVAKDAGQRYAALPEEKKKEFQRKSLEAKAEWEREMEKWKQTLTPEDIKQENMFRTAQRKAGKSRKGNLKDPNAPKKPLSAYFLFLRAIRADPALTESVFEGEQETTKQSVLAASKWRSLPDSEKQPYLEKAEADKTEYERLRREYETLHGVSSAPRQDVKQGKGAKMGQGHDDEDDEDDVDGSHVLGVAGHNPTDHVDPDQFKIDAPFHDDHFIGAPLDDHFAAAGGDHLKPDDF